MKTTLLVSVLVSAFASTSLMAIELKDFSGEFSGACFNHPEVKYEIKVEYNPAENTVVYGETTTADDRYSFEGSFIRINGPKTVRKDPSETTGCVKRTHETKFSKGRLVQTTSERHCYIPMAFRSTYEETMSMDEKGDIKMTFKMDDIIDATCVLKRK